MAVNNRSFLEGVIKRHEKVKKQHQELQALISEKKQAKNYHVEVNKKRVLFFNSLIKAAACLLEESMINELIAKYDLPVKSEEINQLKTKFTDRQAIIAEIKEIFQEFKMQLDDDKDLSMDDACYQVLSKLNEIAIKDFKEHNNPDFLCVLNANHLSPLLDTENQEVDEEFNHAIKQVQTIQRQYRSKQRGDLHFKIFGHPPRSIANLTNDMLSHPRICRIVHELTAARAIINSVYHFTTMENFRSIIRNGHFLGNKYLKNSKLFFRINALASSDEKNGDKNVICFCPWLVDYLAFYDVLQKKIKTNAIRLELDANKFETFGANNQFFKMVDLCSPSFDYNVRINSELQINLSRKGNNKAFFVKITLGDKCEELTLYDTTPTSKHNMIFYGNLYGINRFCLIKIFELLDQAKDPQFKNQFFSYLLSLDDNEIKKILVIFAQSMTVFAEYNVNTVLKNTDHLIKSIHYLDKSMTLDLSDVKESDYQAIMRHIQENDVDELNKLNYKEEQLQTHDSSRGFGKPNLFLYGNEITIGERHVNLGTKDFTHEPAQIYGSGEYVETRRTPSVPFSVTQANTVHRC